MNNMLAVLDWFIQNRLAAAAFVFGAAALGVILYTYVADYVMLIDQD